MPALKPEHLQVTNIGMGKKWKFFFLAGHETGTSAHKADSRELI